MAVEITLTVVSNEGVKFIRTYEGGSDNSRFHAETLVVHGERLVMNIARQLAKLAELEGGPLFDTPGIADHIGVTSQED